MLRLRFAPLSMTGDDAPVVMLSGAKHPIPPYCRVLRGRIHSIATCVQQVTPVESAGLSPELRMGRMKEAAFVAQPVFPIFL